MTDYDSSRMVGFIHQAKYSSYWGSSHHLIPVYKVQISVRELATLAVDLGLCCIVGTMKKAPQRTLPAETSWTCPVLRCPVTEEDILRTSHVPRLVPEISALTRDDVILHPRVVGLLHWAHIKGIPTQQLVTSTQELDPRKSSLQRSAKRENIERWLKKRI